jgi:hypothetical protein
MGSNKPVEKIIDACMLDWEEERPNGGFLKITYKRIQSLCTACNLILVGVPMDTCADTLQKVLTEKMEEARQKWLSATRRNISQSIESPILFSG